MEGTSLQGVVSRDRTPDRKSPAKQKTCVAPTELRWRLAVAWRAAEALSEAGSGDCAWRISTPNRIGKLRLDDNKLSNGRIESCKWTDRKLQMDDGWTTSTHWCSETCATFPGFAPLICCRSSLRSPRVSPRGCWTFRSWRPLSRSADPLSRNMSNYSNEYSCWRDFRRGTAIAWVVWLRRRRFIWGIRVSPALCSAWIRQRSRATEN